MASDLLDRECQVFCGYLLDCIPSRYVLGKYREAHEIAPEFSGQTPLDRFLLRTARRHWFLTKVVDSYARIAAPYCLLRRKLVLLLAILETSPQFSRTINSVEGGGCLSAAWRIFWRSIFSAGCFVLGLVLLLPAHALLRGRAQPAR